MRTQPLLLIAALITARALRVRLSVGHRRRYWAAQAAAPGELLLIALGDSLTQGIGSSRPSTSWLGRYVLHLESSTGQRVRIDNRAAYGARIADLVRSQLPIPAGADRVTVCIGANDARRTAPEQFRDDLRQVCRQLPAGSIVGDVPEFQWGPRVEAAACLSQIVREVVGQFPSLVLAEVQAHTVGTKVLTELAGDFFHPADSGYRRIAAAFIAAADCKAEQSRSLAVAGAQP